VEWFEAAAAREEAELQAKGASNISKVLLFNFLGDRDSNSLMIPLVVRISDSYYHHNISTLLYRLAGLITPSLPRATADLMAQIPQVCYA